MSKSQRNSPPPDQSQRERARDPRRSVLVRAPAGSGKTTLLAERYLRLLAEVDEPGQVVAITFTNAAAAEMRNRVLDQLRDEAPGPAARLALEHSQQLGWNLLDLPAQLRISTIDSFCRELALQQPLLSGLGGGLDIFEQPGELYRRAARRTLEQIDNADPALRDSIVDLLRWRDNNWHDVESQLVDMLANRDRWMHDFVLSRAPDWNLLRGRLERAFTRAAPGPSAARYTDEEWQIVRASFTLLRHAAGELRVVFAEAAAADFIEVAQIALTVLKDESGAPTEATLAVADGIRHLLVDEFQDTSRRQHQLLAHLIAAWESRDGRTCFVVGDPMQSIYSFRGADAELFPRVEQIGLEIPGELPLLFDSAVLTANFRTMPPLMNSINSAFAQIFAVDDGSGITYAKAEPARADGLRSDPAISGPHLVTEPTPKVQLHLEFMPETPRANSRGATPDRNDAIKAQRESACQKQTEEIVGIIRSQKGRTEQARAAQQQYRIAVLGRARKSLVPVALALREAGVPFRAVELERLQDRPEIIDALALARALLNPHDRVAWLGVLRAPWCGLSLGDLHTLSSADNPDLLVRAIPDLLTERKSLLTAEGQTAAGRVLRAIDFAGRLRSTHPTASVGTWLEQVWLSLGGAQCVDAGARANLDLLWKSLDHLPQGEPDLAGSALGAALEKLAAQPDPEADGNCGVQLMTVHKSKGLEFEVVIVPDLQAGTPRGKHEMLSWLERGLPADSAAAGEEDSGEITEFLVAPFQQKGADRGAVKEWVDRIISEREKQEARRILYVAATRARDELHLFARPSYKTAQDGLLTLSDPAESLLKTAWPAFEAEIRARFETWCAQNAVAAPTEITVESIAASAGEAPFAIAPPATATVLRRLPPDFAAPLPMQLVAAAEDPLRGAGRLYERHEGGLLSRALGKAVHALLQQFAQLLVSQPWDVARAAISHQEPRIAAENRAAGVDPPQAARIAAQAVQIALSAASDPIANWILAPHADAASEVRWTGVVDGALRTVQIDRVFRAGSTPQSMADPNTGSADDSSWWIVDYKTAHEEIPSPAAALPELRRIFAPQIETYARVLRNLHGAGAPVFGGLYYPRMSLFDWWEL